MARPKQLNYLAAASSRTFFLDPAFECRMFFRNLASTCETQTKTKKNELLSDERERLEQNMM
jgi:hypothetical protein